MSGYSYLTVAHGLETHYRKVQELDGRGYFGGGTWEIFRCIHNDCKPNEKYIADRKNGVNRLMASDFQTLRKMIFDWEYFNH